VVKQQQQQLQQQNYMTEQVGHQIHTSLSTARSLLAGAGTQTCWTIMFGGIYNSGGSLSGATEEWTGAGAAVTKTITVS
jgi:hypothetical protein